MNWFFLALLSPALDTVINFTDKYIVGNEISDYRGMPIYSTIVAFIAGTIFWIAAGFPLLGMRDALIILGTGMLSIWGLALYFRALSMSDTSDVIIFFKLIPVLVLILSFFILKEPVTAKQLIGFLLVLVATFGVSLEKSFSLKKVQFNTSSPLFLIFCVDVLWAIAAIMVKFSINANSLSKVLSYESWGVTIGGVILYLCFPSIRNAFHTTWKEVRKVALGIMFFNEAVFVLSRSVVFYAYSLGPAALVSVIGGSQVFYGIGLGFALSVLAPKFFKEDISKETLMRKLGFALLLFVGLTLVY